MKACFIIYAHITHTLNELHFFKSPTYPVSRWMISKACFIIYTHLISYLKRTSLFQVPYLSCQQVDDLEGVLDDADGHQLLAVVAAMHHETAHQALHNGALGLAETLHLVAACRVGQVLGILLLDGNVVLWKRKYLGVSAFQVRSHLLRSLAVSLGFTISVRFLRVFFIPIIEVLR